MTNRSLLPLLVSAVFSILSYGLAAADDHLDSAVPASRAWISKIDAGQYDASYDMACSELHDKVDSQKWDAVLKTIRMPWGPVVSRAQVSNVHKPEGIEKLSGECMVITYDTAFKNLPVATEVIVMKWENGHWMGAGYNVGPKITDADQKPVQVQTDTTTQTVKEPPK